MKKHVFILFLLLIFSLQGMSQINIATDKELEKDIVRTGLIHSPLALDYSNSLDAKASSKKVIYSESIDIHPDLSGWTHSGYGQITYSLDKAVSGSGNIRLSYPSYTGKRAQGPFSDPDYAIYGNVSVSLDTKGVNLEKYNRIVFNIYPDCEGARIVNVNFFIENGNSQIKEGFNRQSGSHLINLENRKWNKCFFEIGEYQRDEIVRMGFSVSIKGKDRTGGDSLIYYFGKIELQQIENPEIISGWQPQNNIIVYSTTGYMPYGNKTAILRTDKKGHNDIFELIDTENNGAVYKNKIKHTETSIGKFDVLDFSSYQTIGSYRLKVGDILTPPFRIENNLWENSLWKVLNFIFCQRCGYPVPGKHGTCHIDLCSQHDGKKISYAGGWHDAGDLSQQTLQTADVTFALLEAYNKLKDRNELLALRLLEEAEWGLEFILRNRYGDGYRASSVGLLIWQDGIFGTLDDISTVRVHNHAFDNFLYAGYEAYAALTIDRDPMLQEYLVRVAKEDFRFALEKHEKEGFGEFLHFYEHSYNTSESQYMATASWAASILYKLTDDLYYAEKATEFIGFALACQRREPLKDKDGIKGFFYRNKSKDVIVHFNHQSREQVYMQAMALLCETQPNHPDISNWKASIQLYGDYLKSIMEYTAPYGMIASGIYHIDEWKDDDSFRHSHLFMNGDEKDRFTSQLKKGVRLDNEHYLRRFPVGFGIFNGNTAVHLTMGKAAAICGNFLKDEELLNIGREQLYWTVGKNPFGQSLIYGEGYNYPQMDSFSSGEMVGQMPVGIRSIGDEDIPYWPSTNSATYKEVWTTSAGKWLSLTAEY